MEERIAINEITRLGYPKQWVLEFLTKKSIKVEVWANEKNQKVETISAKDSDKLLKELKSAKIVNYDDSKHVLINEISKEHAVNRTTVNRKIQLLGIKLIPVKSGARIMSALPAKDSSSLAKELKTLGHSNGFRSSSFKKIEG